MLESVASGKSLRVYDNAEIDGTGGAGALGKYHLAQFGLSAPVYMYIFSLYSAQFIVHVVGYNTIKLQCMKHRERWLKIQKNKLAVVSYIEQGNRWLPIYHVHVFIIGPRRISFGANGGQ